MELVVGGQHLALGHRPVAAAIVADEAARLADQQYAGGDVPAVELFLPEAVVAAGGDPGEVERGRSEAAHPGDLRRDRVQYLLEAGKVALALPRHAGGDQSVGEVAAG